MINKLKIFITYVILTPWIGGFLYENILPDSISYWLARFIGLLTYGAIVFFGIGYFIFYSEDLLKEIKEQSE